MTDAREIIRIAAEDKMKFDGFSSYDEMAAHLIDALTASGFRILGPDEVDPVTVERAAEAAYEAITDGEHAEEVSAAVRALGRKA